MTRRRIGGSLKSHCRRSYFRENSQHTQKKIWKKFDVMQFQYEQDGSDERGPRVRPVKNSSKLTGTMTQKTIRRYETFTHVRCQHGRAQKPEQPQHFGEQAQKQDGSRRPVSLSEEKNAGAHVIKSEVEFGSPLSDKAKANTRHQVYGIIDEEF